MESPSSSVHEDKEHFCPVRHGIRKAWHSDIPPLWLYILGAERRRSPSLVQDWYGFDGLRFELRKDAPSRLPTEHGPRDFTVNGIIYGGRDTVKVFHHTKIEALTNCSEYAPRSRGILHEGVCFGTCTHNSKCGVNYYSITGEYGFWTAGQSGWAALELEVSAGSKLAGGSKARYCITRDNLGDHRRHHLCPFAGITAMWVMYKDAPELVKF